ncbi:MAG: L-lactate permease [Nanoarchaeota archaeon]
MLIEILAFFPFAVLFILMIGFRISAMKSVPLAWIVLVLLSLIIWKVSLIILGVSMIKGFFVAIEIMLIIFGAIFLLAILKNTKQLSVIQGFLSSINPDARVQVILIAFLFNALIEGVAGFGTPAAMAAPLLASAGFPPILAVVAPLISDALPVSFGAAGVPITIGLGSLGFSHEMLMSVTKMTALLHSISSIVIPLFLVYLTVSYSKTKTKRKAVLEALPFALFSWLVFIAIYFSVAYFIGPELPSILAGFGSLLICGFAAKKRFLQPKSEICFAHHHKKIQPLKKQVMISILPYLVIVLFLLISRSVPYFKKFLSSVTIGTKSILSSGVSYSFQPLYTPAFAFIIVSLMFAFFIGKKSEISASLIQTLQRIKKPAIALTSTLVFVQLLIVSGINNSGLPAFPLLVAKTIVGLFKEFYVFVAPLVGSVGAFVGGSNTVSNLLFASLQAEAAVSIGAPVVLLLALQVVGGAIGNMFAIHNILAAEATVHLHNQEGHIIRKVILAASAYAIIAGLVGLVIFYFF